MDAFRHRMLASPLPVKSPVAATCQLCDRVQGLVGEAARAVGVPQLHASGRGVAPQDAVIAAAGEISGSRDLPAGVDRVQGLVGEAARAVRVPQLDTSGRGVAPKDAVVAAAGEISGSATCQLVLTGFRAS